jgi:hypothetical protein
MLIMKKIINTKEFFSLDLYNFYGPNIDAFSCNKQDSQVWIWNITDGTVRSKHTV